MATRLTAINAYRPRIDLGNTVQNEELIRFMADRTNLNKSMVALIVGQMSEAVVFFNATGRGVKLEGLGTYLPNIDLDGAFSIDYRLDNAIKNGLNAKNIFTGTIKFSENIGKTPDELVAIWNENHPDDKVA
jgi:hypothetical protein